MGPRPKARKNLLARSSLSIVVALQWGRARRRGRTEFEATPEAEIKPLQWGRARRRGRTVRASEGSSARTRRFNGAAPEGAEERTAERAPAQRERCFNGAAPEGAEERRTASGSSSYVQSASMGPRPKARKNACGTVYPARGQSTASMGPRPKARKNSPRQATFAGLSSFNGAAPEGAEERLQWGWFFADVSSFNGAAPEGAEELPSIDGHFSGWVASMGPRPKARKNLRSWYMANDVMALQWGRARRRGRTSRTDNHQVPTT